MSRVITFSKTFPAYHPKAGQPTYFVEKLWAWLADNTDYTQGNLEMDWYEYYNCISPKHHTIRAGKCWKAGDKFSPRIWSGKPYNSSQIIIAPDIEIKRVWDIKIDGFCIWIKETTFSTYRHGELVAKLAENDGLSLVDFWDWFPQKRGKVFTGQIICWSDKIEY